MPSPRLIPLALAFAVLPIRATAQIIRNPAAHAAGDSESTAPRDIDVGRRAQVDFENFHRANIPWANTRPPANCDETVGRFCYWYDERAPAPPREPITIT